MTVVLARLFACLLLILGAGRVMAESPPSPSDLLDTEKQLEQSQLRQKDLDEKLDASLRAEEALSQQLVAAANGIRDGQQRLAESQAAITALKKNKATLDLELAARQDELSEVLAGLQRLEMNPPPALVVKPHDVLAALRSAMLFGTLAPDLRRAAADVEQRLSALAETENRLAAESRAEEETLLTLARARQEMDQLLAGKRAMAKALKQDLAAEERRATELAKKAETLRELLAALAAEEAKRAAAQGKEEAERRAAEERRKELASQPQVAFSDLKGRLAYPVSGRIAKRFGEDTGLGHPLDGIVIATAAGAGVTSPVAGRIEFAGPFRSYGDMVIVNAGHGFLLILAGLGQVDVASGQSIKAGEPVGRMAARPLALALAKDLPLLGKPVLYIELRNKSEPVDPTPWWSGPEPVFAKQEAMR